MPSKTHPQIRLPLWRLLALCCCLAAMPSQAEKADRDQPLQIEADSMRHDESRQLTQFTGHVLASKGSLLLRAARMDVQQNAQGRQVATLWAAPQERVFFRQKREGTNEFTEGEAEKLSYDNQTDTITLVQRAEVRILRGAQVADRLTGHTIVLNNVTEVMTVDGQSASPEAANASSPGGQQRVRATLTPRNGAPPAAPPPAAQPQWRTSPALVPRTAP